MLTVGHRFPEFSLTGVVSADPQESFQVIDNKYFKGRWLVFFAWPKDFSLVCPTEIIAFGDMMADFKEREAVVLGMSTDSDYVHLAWRQSHKQLANLPFPMLSDIKRELSQDLGILHDASGVCLRSTFIVDPQGVIRHVSVNDLKTGRNPDETLRVLDALQTDELCQCNWVKGDATLKSI